MIGVFALCLLLQNPTPDSHVWERYSVVGKQHWTAAVTQADIDEAPKWELAVSDAPPLSPGEAIRAARTLMQKLTLESATGKWHVGSDGVSLHPASHGWIYIVNFEDSPQGCEPPPGSIGCGASWGSSGGMNIIVLMSGRAIVPVLKQ
jgi:hypothetical protein